MLHSILGQLFFARQGRPNMSRSALRLGRQPLAVALVAACKAAPTATPQPTATPRPTSTSAPAATPTPASTPVSLPAPTLTITSPAESSTVPAGDIKVTVQVTNFNLVDKLGQANVPGHIHYLIDATAPTTPGQPAVTPSGIPMRRQLPLPTPGPAWPLEHTRSR